MTKLVYGVAAAAWLVAGCGANSAKKSSPDMAKVGGGSNPDMAGVSCDGVEATDVLVHIYPFSQNTMSCDPAQMKSFNKLIGIWDVFAESGATDASHVLKPTRCSDVMGMDDLGGGTKTWDGKTVPMGGPATFQSIATIKGAFTAAGGQTVTTVGVVSAIQPWKSGSGGSFYIEDATGAANSGIQVYSPKTITTAAPNVGDLVEVDGMTALYPAMIGAKQITATALKQLDTGYKLSAVQTMPAAMLGKDSTAADQYEGLRVQAADTLTVTNACPAELQYVSKGGSGGGDG
jgi:predicted extracellular nuclease